MEATRSRTETQIRIGSDLTLTIGLGERLLDICDRTVTPISFSCRSGSCGTCAIRVLQGMTNLSPLNANEEIVIDDLENAGPGVRLACQIQVFGEVHVEPLERG
jgi:2Fe-2S ferredoxin